MTSFWNKARTLAVLPAMLATARLAAQAPTAKQDSVIADTLRRITPGIKTKRDRTKQDSVAKVIETRWLTAPNTGPTAVIQTVTCDVTRRCVATQASTDDRGVVSYAWNWGDGASSTASSPSHTYNSYGTFTLSLSVKDAAGLTGNTTRQIVLSAPVDSLPPVDTTTKPPSDTALGITPPVAPKAVPDASVKSCSRHVDVNQIMLLQSALDGAQPGDCLDLAPGAKWVGNFVLPNKGACSAGTPWVTVQTKGAVLVAGSRATRSATFAQVVTDNNQPAIVAAHPSCNWQVMSLNINVAASYTGVQYWLLAVGDGGWVGGGEKNVSLAVQPYNFIFRGNWIHGQPTSNLIRCVAVNSINTAIVDNVIEDCHASGFDSQAVEGWNGAGPYLIENNFLAGAGENIMFGGADPSIAGLSPSDITIRRNHFYKDPLWKGVWTIKNIFELKNARRVRVEANVFENTWIQAQMGMSIVLKSSGDVNAANTKWQGTQDVTIEWNRMMNSHRGFNVQGVDCSGQTCVDSIVKRVLFRNNLLTGIGTSNGVPGSDGWLMLFSDAPQDVYVGNNTFVGNTPDIGLSMYLNGRVGQWNNLRVKRNVLAGQGYYAIGADCPQAVGTAALDCVVGPGKWSWDGNIVSEVDQQFWGNHPSGNSYKQAIGEIGLTATFSQPVPGVGVDVAVLNAKTAGVAMPASQLASRPRAAARRPSRAPTPADVAFCAAHGCLVGALVER